MSNVDTIVSPDGAPSNTSRYEVQRLAPLVLFALPLEASQGMTMDEMVALFNRLEGCIGRQIRVQCCHHPSTLRNVLQQLQRDGFVASTYGESKLSNQPRFWRVSISHSSSLFLLPCLPLPERMSYWTASCAGQMPREAGPNTVHDFLPETGKFQTTMDKIKQVFSAS